MRAWHGVLVMRGKPSTDFKWWRMEDGHTLKFGKMFLRRWLGTLQECSVLPEGFIRPDVYTAFIPLILWILVTQKAMISLSIRIVY